MTIRIGTRRLGWASAALWLLACDPSVFDRARGVSVSTPAHAGESGAGTLTIPVADAGLISVTTGTGGRQAQDAGASPAADGGGGTGAVAGMTGRAGGGGTGAGAAGDAGHGPIAGGAGMPAADGGAPRSCPRLPASQDDSFCYDFESGLRGPNGGDSYDLWTNPELATSAELTVVSQPDAANNQVLQTVPRANTSDASAALGHSTRHFARATAEFDVWVNDALLQASEDVSWFRFVPVDGDDVHVTALIFRRGQALLRSESSTMEYPLRKLPRTDGRPAHVSVHLERGSACSVDVMLDGEAVASTPAGACVGDSNGFVEYGLVMLDASKGSVSAYYDDVTFTRE